MRTKPARTATEKPAGRISPGSATGTAAFEAVLAQISEGASARDTDPAFPHRPFRVLTESGLLSLPIPEPVETRGHRASFGEEWRILRAVTKADGSVGRIFDGHLNPVERVAVLAPEPLRTRELEEVVAGELLLGVWGADPISGEGPPASWRLKAARS